MQHIPLMMLPPNISKAGGRKLQGIGTVLAKRLSGLEEALRPAGINISAGHYVGMAIANAITLSGVFTVLMAVLMYAQLRPILEIIGLSIAIGAGMTLVFMLLYTRYPKILALKRAEALDQDLIYALKDLVIQISSGNSLYYAFKDLSKSEYEPIREQFTSILQKIDTGKSTIRALEEAALATQSEYFKRACWQIINSLKTGSNLKEILNRIIGELAMEQKNKIRNYARELNLWSLLYMLFAVAVPSIGSTMLVILSSFAGFGINKAFFIVFIVISFIIQAVLVGFVKSRRPMTQ